MADFWGGVAKGFAPAYESARARRIRAEEREEDKAERDRLRAEIQKRELEKLEAEAGGFSDLEEMMQRRDWERTAPVDRPFVPQAMTQRPIVPRLEDRPLTAEESEKYNQRSRLIRSAMVGKGRFDLLQKEMAERESRVCQTGNGSGGINPQNGTDRKGSRPHQARRGVSCKRIAIKSEDKSRSSRCQQKRIIHNGRGAV